MKKYELTNAIRAVDARTLHRIRSLRSFGDVKEGEFGGWVEKEKNLAHGGDCWVYHEACVYDNARVTENALVAKDAWVYGNARIYGCARVFGAARVYDTAHVFGSTLLEEEVRVYGSVRIYGRAWIHGRSMISGDTILKFSSYRWHQNINLDHGTWEDVIEINDKTYFVSNMLDLYEVP